MNVFDLLSTQICVMDKPLVIAEYHYGAMCIRGSPLWLGKASMITSEGHDRVNGNHTKANWVVMHGKVDGKECGIAAFGHPDNFRTPQPVRLHPKKPYFCFAPMVAGEFSLEPGKPYVSHFRFAAFDGKPDLALLDEIWKDLTR